MAGVPARLQSRAPPISLLATFTSKVARHFGVPISLVSVITQDQRFWTASCGLPRATAPGGRGRNPSAPTRARAAALEAASSPYAFVEALQLERFTSAIPAAIRQLEGALGDAGLA